MRHVWRCGGSTMPLSEEMGEHLYRGTQMLFPWHSSRFLDPEVIWNCYAGTWQRNQYFWILRCDELVPTWEESDTASITDHDWPFAPLADYYRTLQEATVRVEKQRGLF